MKVRLVGINEDTFYTAPTVQADAPYEPKPQQVFIARLEYKNCDGNNITMFVPYGMVRGAEIGDEFTLHLERVSHVSGKKQG